MFATGNNKMSLQATKVGRYSKPLIHSRIVEICIYDLSFEQC